MYERKTVRQGIRILLFLMLALSCGRDEDRDPSAPLSVAVSIAPQIYFVDRIGGDRVNAFAVIPEGFSPATYEPSPARMRALSEADVYFSTGVPFEESWLPRIEQAIPGLRIVESHAGIDLLPISHADAENDEDNLDGDSHGTLDPHVWLSPELIASQVDIISKTLMEIDPAGEQVYRRGRDSLLLDIAFLQQEMHELLDPVSGTSFVVFHPAWGYFADEFGLVQIPVEIDGHEPSLAQLADLITLVGERDVRFIFVSPQFSDASARTIAEQSGIGLIEIDPLAEDWLQNMRIVAARMREALERE